MKKVLATVLSLMLAIGLVACGGGGDSSKLSYDMYEKIDLSKSVEEAAKVVGSEPKLDKEYSDDKTEVYKWTEKQEGDDASTYNITLTVDKKTKEIVGKSTNIPAKKDN